MPANEYHFVTHWRVSGSLAEVADIIQDAPSLPKWWPAVYLDVQQLEPGGENGIGKRVSLYTKGWLPYTLRWSFRVTESDYPHSFGLKADGDFDGRGIWTLEDHGGEVVVTYDWKLKADKPLLKAFSFLLKPIFEANHRWAMAKGEESLKLELLRRRARSDREAAAVRPPPAPTFPHNLRRSSRAPVS